MAREPVLTAFLIEWRKKTNRKNVSEPGKENVNRSEEDRMLQQVSNVGGKRRSRRQGDIQAEARQQRKNAAGREGPGAGRCLGPPGKPRVASGYQTGQAALDSRNSSVSFYQKNVFVQNFCC